MKASLSLLACALASTVLALPVEDGTLAVRQASTGKVYLAGDSTMANLGPTSKTQGWGNALGPYLKVPFANRAIGGRSARSYTAEGRFAKIIADVKPGDYVVIEFGHNDGGSLSPIDNGRTDCFGTGNETCVGTYANQPKVVYTFNKYIQDAGKAIAKKGAYVVYSSMTPNNPYGGTTGKFAYAPSRFAEFCEDSAKAVGEMASYVDHGSYTADTFKTVGAAMTNSYFPQDHTHTSQIGAAVVADTFVRALMCSESPMKDMIKPEMAKKQECL
ncbi:carbohydrate esterase family 12 protein [Aulographum hederae CBS 113979]|uniref:Carbohydrate esterase family 12 protein n=1 Tax=Aulographum hederae CBS 113979 TaxID=1176131 RepID=A0A6G1H7G9_9PEZI|nr:carbohydrate esterase family 12 protein [Aulographum hederae CBS 113979]